MPAKTAKKKRKRAVENFDKIFWGKGADKQLVEGAKALAHPIRLQILRYLINKSHCLCGDFVRVFPLAQSTVSQHLKVLKESGLIWGEVKGTSSPLQINEKALKSLKVLIAAL
ncbi:MAG: metalloregulator ArsR/SmtB family transcription factor [bacterium]|nr:metalloregulator ArsR/SmtB family transcription factor [bacterium]